MTRKAPAGRPEAYRGTVIAVGTRHGKALQLASAFDRHLGAGVVVAVVVVAHAQRVRHCHASGRVQVAHRHLVAVEHHAQL